METALTTVESNPKEHLIISPGNDQQALGDMFSYISHSLTESSIAMYKHAFKNYFAFASGHHLTPTAPRTLEAYRDYMIFHTTKSPLTINREIASIKRLAKEAARRNLLSRDDAYDFANIEGASMNRLKNRMKHSKSIPLSKAQMQLLCNVPDTSTLLGMRDKALLYTLATSGVRASELASLRVDRIFHVDGGYIIQVMGKRDNEYRDASIATTQMYDTSKLTVGITDGLV
jgi:integrase/recombinase XerD